MFSERVVLDLVGTIYSAVDDPARWPVFLERLAEALRSKSTTLFMQDLRRPGGTASATFGTDPSFSRSYAEYYGAINIFLLRGRQLLTTGNVCSSNELCPDEETVRSEFYNDWVLPQDAGQGLLGTIFNQDSLAGNIGAIRARGAKPFAAEDKHLLQVLMPHLQRAVQLHRRIANLEALGKWTGDALDRWSVAVCLVDRTGRVIHANQAAAHLFRQADGLALDRKILHTAYPSSTARLLQLVRDAAEMSGGRPSGAGGVLLIARPSGRRPFSVVVSPSVREDMFLGVCGTALVFLHDPETEHEPESAVLQRLYGLTRAEAAVASLLGRGRNVKEIAEEVAVRENTVRIHLKRIFDKTGAKRQAELVKLVLSGPAALRKPSMAAAHYPCG